MQISLRDSDHVIVQFGTALGDLDGCSIQDVSDELLPVLGQPGTKVLQEDGTVTVTPPDPEPDLTTQRLADAETIFSVLPTPEARDALARLLGLPPPS